MLYCCFGCIRRKGGAVWHPLSIGLVPNCLGWCCRCCGVGGGGGRGGAGLQGGVGSRRRLLGLAAAWVARGGSSTIIEGNYARRLLSQRIGIRAQEAAVVMAVGCVHITMAAMRHGNAMGVLSSWDGTRRDATPRPASQTPCPAPSDPALGRPRECMAPTDAQTVRPATPPLVCGDHARWLPLWGAVWPWPCRCRTGFPGGGPPPPPRQDHWPRVAIHTAPASEQFFFGVSAV